MTRKSIAMLICTAGAAILLAACGGSSSSGDSTTGSAQTSGGSSGGGADAVSIKNFAYAPPSLTVDKGATVSFSNQDSTEHTATANGGAFDTGSIGQGQSKSITLNSAGTFSYVCTFHPFMHGTITVK